MLLVFTSEHGLQSVVFFFPLNIMQNFACKKKSYTHIYIIVQSIGPFQPRPLYDSMISMKSSNPWSYPDIILTLCKTKKYPVLEMYQSPQANHARVS